LSRFLSSTCSYTVGYELCHHPPFLLIGLHRIGCKCKLINCNQYNLQTYTKDLHLLWSCTALYPLSFRRNFVVCLREPLLNLVVPWVKKVAEHWLWDRQKVQRGHIQAVEKVQFVSNRKSLVLYYCSDCAWTNWELTWRKNDSYYEELENILHQTRKCNVKSLPLDFMLICGCKIFSDR
jgi:hypothetical protein